MISKIVKGFFVARVTGIAVSPSGQVLSAGHIDFLRIPAFPVGFGGDTVLPDMIRVPIGEGGVIDFTLIEGAYAAVWSLGRVEVEFAFTVSDAADIQFNEGLGAPPMPDAAPAIVAQGSVSPASGAVGTQFTFTAPVVSGRPTPVVTRVVTLNGSPITVVGNSYTSTAEGALAVTWTASNGVSPDAVSTDSATVTEASNAPVVTQQPSITPSSATVGDSVTINLGAATGAVGEPTWTLMRGATDVTAQVDDFMAIEFTTAGAYTLSASWTNAHGTTTATPATITVAEAPTPGVDLEAVSYVHQDGPLPYTGTASVITGFTAEGSGARTFSIVGTGAEVGMDPARGPLFASGKYARNAGNSASIADGVMILAEYEVDTATASDTVIALTGGVTINMRFDAGTNRIQYNYNVSGSAVNANGVTGAARMNVLAMEIDRVAGTIRYWDGEKIVTLTGQTITSPAFTTIDIGNSLTGVVTRSNVITRGSGAAWPISFEDALNEYGAGVTPPFP